jgi:hypothetical protein
LVVQALGGADHAVEKHSGSRRRSCSAALRRFMQPGRRSAPGLRMPLPIRVTAEPLNASDPAADRVGRLRFEGGLDLTSSDRRFGGISALLWFENCGRLLAASDTGAWIILEPDEVTDA